MGADQDEVGEIADKLVEEGEEHGGGSCPIDPRPARATVSRPPQVYALPAQGARIRLDAARCTAQALQEAESERLHTYPVLGASIHECHAPLRPLKNTGAGSIVTPSPIASGQRLKTVAKAFA